MTELTVTLCGQTTTIACAPEDEERLNQLIAMISERAENARAIVGENDRWRQMLFTAIFLADELDGGETAPSAGAMHPHSQEDAVLATRLMAVAKRISAALDRIETATARA